MKYDQLGESRRSVLKKGALASGALALGTGAGAGAAAAQGERVLVFSPNFYPGESLDVMAQLPKPITVRVLQTVDEETVPEIDSPDDYAGHVIRYDNGGGDAEGVTAFLFTRENKLDDGDSETLSDSASMFSPQLNLVRTSFD
ncbi:calcium-binding protein [Salinilacihabitans rarus]|uniref:calcium-binding protein n=1 Tax=Salinilacihabitans rarus TaxID=2961596 RepID=UPI0020C89DA1|nr:calcium-binding protein [Salinilacihabitans rarus]